MKYKIELVQKKTLRGKKYNYWSVSSKTTIRQLSAFIGKEQVQRLMVKAIDHYLYKATSKEVALATLEDMRNTKKDFETSNIRNQLDKAIRNRDMKTARQLFKQLL